MCRVLAVKHASHQLHHAYIFPSSIKNATAYAKTEHVCKHLQKGMGRKKLPTDAKAPVRSSHRSDWKTSHRSDCLLKHRFAQACESPECKSGQRTVNLRAAMRKRTGVAWKLLNEQGIALRLIVVSAPGDKLNTKGC